MFAVFADKFGIEEKQALMLAAPFGGGFAQTRETCGAICGMFMVMGLAEGFSVPDKQTKAEFYSTLREMQAQFVSEYKTINCAHLLQYARDGGIEKPCDQIVALAVEITQARLDS